MKSDLSTLTKVVKKINYQKVTCVIVAAFFLLPIMSGIVGIMHLPYAYGRIQIFYKWFETGIFDSIYFDIGAAMVVVAYIRRRMENKPFMFPVLFILAIAWMLISTVANGWMEYSQACNDEYENETVVSQIGYMAITFALCAMLTKQKYRRFIIYAFLICANVLAVISIYLWQNIADAPLYGWEVCLCGPFFNTNHYGYYLTVAVMLSAAYFVFMTNNRVMSLLMIASVCLNTVVLSFNNTFGAWLACLTSLVFMLILCRIVRKEMTKRALLIMGIFVGTTIITGFWTDNVGTSLVQTILDILNIFSGAEDADKAGSLRWPMWIATCRFIAENPLFGMGFECIYVQQITDLQNYTRPHNEYLQYALFYGIPAAVFYTGGCMTPFFRGLKHRRELDDVTLAALVTSFGYLVSAFFGITMFYTTPYLFIFLGLANPFPPIYSKTGGALLEEDAWEDDNKEDEPAEEEAGRSS